MKSYYREHPKFHVAVDCVIFGFKSGRLHLLLLKRDFEPSKGEWSLMGGFVKQQENLDDAARRVLAELTGLENVYMRQAGAFGAVDRDPGERVISVAYYALVDIDQYDQDLVRKHNAFWVEIKKIPPLIFDHNQMVSSALQRVRHSASDRPIVFNLLPEQFTLTMFQNLYESLFGVEFDKRNFRKKVAMMEFVEKTGEIDKLSSKRGAALYRFNPDKYQGVFKI